MLELTFDDTGIIILVALITLIIATTVLLIAGIKDHIESVRNKAYDLGTGDAIDATNASAKATKHFAARHTADEFVGKKCMYFPNEWTDPCFFIGMEVREEPKFGDGIMLVGKELFTGNEVYMFPETVYEASPKMVNAILKLNPFERWNLSKQHYRFEKAYKWEKTYASDKRTPAPELRKKLQVLNFID